MMLFAVDADGSPIGVAATPTPEAAISLIRALHRAQETALPQLSSILARPASDFEKKAFERSDIAKQSPGTLQGRAPKAIEFDQDPAAKRETLELVRAYYRIKDLHVRLRLTNIIRAIAASADD